jgi:hypothetical protein
LPEYAPGDPFRPGIRRVDDDDDRQPAGWFEAMRVPF